LPANMPRIRFKDNDLEHDITEHKVTKPAVCPECGAYCYYPSNGDTMLNCHGKCGKSWKEDTFLKKGDGNAK